MQKTFLFSPADFGGCGHYRVIQRAMVWNTIIHPKSPETSPIGKVSTHYLSNQELDEHNVALVLLQRQYESPQVKSIQRYRDRGNMPIIMDWDDLLWNLPYSNPIFSQISNQKKQNMRECAKIAHLNVVSTVPLSEELRKFSGQESVLLPNFLDPMWYTDKIPERDSKKQFTVIWAGSSTHNGDLALVKNVIKHLPDVKFVIFGYRPPGFSSLPNVEFISGVEFAKYPHVMKAICQSGIRAALAPLETHPFNDAKSNLKLLEYGALGLPVVSSLVYPYKNNDPDLLIENKKNNATRWIEVIRSLQHDETYRMEKAKKSFDYAKSFDSTNPGNIEAFKDVVTQVFNFN
jgi:glycosyltransferase involved in cell wall biosynthesis